VRSLSPSQRQRLLSDSQFFAVFAQAQLDQLAARLIELRYSDRQAIFGRGDPGSSMMVVVEGRVRIGITSATGRELLLGIIEPGQIFGELALLDGMPRSADATAFGDCVVLSLDRRDFLPLLRQSPDAAIRLSEIVCRRLRAANDQIEGTALLTVEARLARLLLQLASRDGPSCAAARVSQPLSQGDLGRLIGASRQKVNLFLGRWMADGVLARDGQAIVIRDRERLEGVADGT
jgi:CRP/FNR family cyclic AMP-dependent transcriptional regulator